MSGKGLEYQKKSRGKVSLQVRALSFGRLPRSLELTRTPEHVRLASERRVDCVARRGPDLRTQ